MKVMSGVFLLAWVPLAVANGDAAYPKEKIAEFVIEKLDLTSIPSAVGSKREKGKKTFGDYGYVTRKLEDNEAVVEAPQGSPQISISILEESKSGIYACFNAQAPRQSTSQIQRVFLLKLNNGSGLLKGRESGRNSIAVL